MPEHRARSGSTAPFARTQAPSREHDACGVGFIARATGERSHEIVRLALQAVARVAHRGAASTDNSGDGAGILTQIPHRLFHREAYRLGLRLSPGQPFGVGVFFLPPEHEPLSRARRLVETILAQNGIPCLGWRDVPVDPGALGPIARASCPAIRQVFVGRPVHALDEEAWERALYLARRDLEREAEQAGLDPFFICSFSCRTIVYKALLTGTQLPVFYPDLRYPEFESAVALFHQRYSTNTLPSWPLAQPFRMIAHNGEINTLWGNRNAMAARESDLQSPIWGNDIERLKPVIWEAGSDSAGFDNTMELLVRSGRDPLHTIMMLVPQAWERYPDVEPAIRDFYRFHAHLTEPWDGPAALAFTDGVIAGAATDRNGLRPCRYKVTRDQLVVAGSEVGLVDLDPREVIESGRLGPCEFIAVDLHHATVLRNMDVKRRVASRQPYGQWCRENMQVLEADPAARFTPLPASELAEQQVAFGYGNEDLRFVLDAMGGTGQDPVWSMGDDAPIPPLARTPVGVYAYFRQRFAQVTNPPIDPLRESVVMSLRQHIGKHGSFLIEHPSLARVLRVDHPVLLDEEMAALRNTPGFSCVTLHTVWPAAEGPEGLRAGLDRLCAEAEHAARNGARLLVLSDRAVDRGHTPIPMLLAVGAVRRHLMDNGLRMRLGLVAEAGDAWDIHHFAALIGYGCEVVYPWLALQSVTAVFGEDSSNPESDGEDAATGRRAGGAARQSRYDAPDRPGPEEARRRYRAAAEKGLLKIMSKMGISVLPSYNGAQIFECLGLGQEVVQRCFRSTDSPIGGIGLEEIAEDALTRHRVAYGDNSEIRRSDTPAESGGAPAAGPPAVPDYGRIRFRKDGEEHGWAPPVVVALQKAVGSGKGAKRLEGDDAAAGYARFKDYVSRVEERRPSNPRDLLGFKRGEPIPLDEVEPVDSIMRRFVSSAMSLGALSPEAHATISIAMNRIGARSNSGEGGEDPFNYAPLPSGDRVDNRVKQVASGRFGVTTEYLIRAEELEIKVVQGAKPGEGGQLPGHKVTELIARLRHSVVGIPLISPPPHHDIYSIEDLAQLILDLKTVNPRARVGVKLVAETGVGTVAAGVAKAYADYVLIAGHSGGTGASPLSSIKHAGSPWELGLAESQATLVANGLRHRIEVRTDGGFRTGRDVVIAALLGAESFGFGTAPLIAMGCAMARQCHLNTCPTGVATQRPDLRAKFKGTPDQVVTFFSFVAEQVREILASLGARSLNEIVGRADLLERVERPDIPRAQMLDLSMLMTPARPGPGTDVRRTVERNDRPGVVYLDDEILEECGSHIAQGLPFSGFYDIRNHHLAVGARVAGAIAGKHGDAGLPAGHLHLRFRGSAGQSFGAFAIHGMHLDLEGEANDYVGKGLSGGEISIRPFRQAAYAQATHENTIVGNTCLYGATSGKLFAAGQAASRFAVRNSGAVAVIEGAGNHCCEYMTSGLVVVLGAVGRNFGAGMSNGVAYVLDESGGFESRVNTDMVRVDVCDEADEIRLLSLIHEHQERTGSARAKRLIEQWEEFRSLFKKVVPNTAPAASQRNEQPTLPAPEPRPVPVATP
ncbi:MAG TPA: glutamate synthase-related protein [Gemmatimonadales bacterium]|jgi:glutamate synthase (NADPH/NADH) large chain/glutamate synthase (ferredoxin)